MLLGGPFGSAAQEPVQLKVEKTGDTLCRLGFITVDNARRVATIPATVNDAVMGGPLEFVGNTKGTVPGEPGWLAYESALENAVLGSIDLQILERKLNGVSRVSDL